MLTPMMIQYLVGLCCLRHDPDAVDITLGNMVYDSAAKKARDVDVTVTIKKEDGSYAAFKAVEVKAERHPIDVETVEQLCLKLSDMTQVTHKAIFSTSGYTSGAKAKAAAHGVNLYTLIPWDTPIENDLSDFKGVGKPTEFLKSVESRLLYWVDYHIYVVVPDGPASFNYSGETVVYTESGKKHLDSPSMKVFTKKIISESSGILCTQPEILSKLGEWIVPQNFEKAVGPTWPYTHRMITSTKDAYLKFEDKLCRIDETIITGKLQWRCQKLDPQFYILKDVFNGKVFAGAAIADYGTNDGRMFAMVFPEAGRELGIHPITIPEKQRNLLRNLRIK